MEWKVSQCDDGKWMVHTDGDIIALDVTEKNARLIAAAPELQDAVGKALNFIENTENELGITLSSGDAARAALGKATNTKVKKYEHKATTPETHAGMTKADAAHLRELLEEVRMVYASAEHAGVMLQLGHYRRLSSGQEILRNLD